MLKVRNIRQLRLISLRKLSKKSSVGLNTLVRMEAERWDPRLSTLQRVAKALNVSVGELIGEKIARNKGGK